MRCHRQSPPRTWRALRHRWPRCRRARCGGTASEERAQGYYISAAVDAAATAAAAAAAAASCYVQGTYRAGLCGAGQVRQTELLFFAILHILILLLPILPVLMLCGALPGGSRKRCHCIFHCSVRLGLSLQHVGCMRALGMGASSSARDTRKCTARTLVHEMHVIIPSVLNRCGLRHILSLAIFTVRHGGPCALQMHAARVPVTNGREFSGSSRTALPLHAVAALLRTTHLPSRLAAQGSAAYHTATYSVN